MQETRVSILVGKLYFSRPLSENNCENSFCQYFSLFWFFLTVLNTKISLYLAPFFSFLHRHHVSSNGCLSLDKKKSSPKLLGHDRYMYSTSDIIPRFKKSGFEVCFKYYNPEMASHTVACSYDKECLATFLNGESSCCLGQTDSILSLS